jgi:putative transposase
MGDAHFLTFSTINRMNLLSELELAEIVANKIFSVSQEMRFDTWGFVIMPNHCHLLCFCREDPHSVSDYLASIKRQSARECFIAKPSLRNLCVSPRRDREDEYRLWMPGGGFDKNISDPNAILNSLEYLHQNPVKKGLCETATDWRFSSASFYETGVSEWPLVRYPG